MIEISIFYFSSPLGEGINFSSTKAFLANLENSSADLIPVNCLEFIQVVNLSNQALTSAIGNSKSRTSLRNSDEDNFAKLSNSATVIFSKTAKALLFALPNKFENQPKEIRYFSNRCVKKHWLWSFNEIFFNSRIIEKEKTGVGQLGSTLVLKKEGNAEELAYFLVGAAEADPLKGKISNESPLGSALMGRKKGESVEVLTPGGKIKYTITDVN